MRTGVASRQFLKCAKRVQVKPSSGRRWREGADDGRHYVTIKFSAKAATCQAFLFGGRWPEGPDDGTRMRRLSRSDTCFFVYIALRGVIRDESRGVFPRIYHAACGSCGVIPRRTPVVFHSLSSPWKKENETRERRRRQGKIRLYSGGAPSGPPPANFAQAGLLARRFAAQ